MEVSEKTKEELLEEISKLKEKIKTNQILFPGISVINRYENTLNRLEERFKSFSEATTEAIVLHEKGIMIDANDEAYRMFGYSSNDILGKSVLEFAAPESHKTIIKNLKAKSTDPYEAVAIKKDGSKFPCTLQAKDITYCGRKVRAVTIRDITELKDKEAAILESERYYKESEEKYRVLFENNVAGVFRSTLDGKFIRTNKAFARIFGYESPEDINKISSKDVYYSVKDRDEYLQRLQKEKVLHNYPLKLKNKKGETIWISANVTLLEDPLKEKKYIEGTLIDITEQKHHEKELEISRETYRHLIEYSPDGIFIHNEEGKVLFANPSALEMVGVGSLEELESKNLLTYTLPEYHKEIKERKQAVFQGADLPFTEAKIKRKTGEIIEIESKPTLINYQGKKAVLVVYHNLSSQRLLQREKLKLQMAEEANKHLQQEIKERRKAERRLLQSQKFVRSIIDSSLDMIVATNKEGEITEFNHAAQKIFGYKPEEVLSKNVNILFYDARQRERIISQLMEGVGAFAGEIINVRKNGETFISYLSASVLRNEKGEIIGAMGVSRDITLEKVAERELAKSEERYRVIFNQAYIGIAQVGLDGKFLHVNDQLCKILGYTKEEMLRKKFQDITHPSDMEKSLQLREVLLMGKIPNFTTEKKYIHKSGSIIHAGLTSSLVRDNTGKPEYFVSVFQDITEKRAIINEIEMQAAKLNAIIESSSHLIWTVDRELRLTSFNQNTADAIRAMYRLKPYIGMSIVEGKMISSEETNSVWMRKAEEAFKGRPQHFESKITDKYGVVRWMEVYFNPIFGPSGTISEVSGIGHDITEKKEAENKIKQSLKEKEVLLKEVHHRVKNNLQVISSILNLQSSYVKDKNTLQILKESQNRIKSMAYIHESLYQTKDFASINFSEYIENITRSLVHSYVGNENNIELRLDVKEVFLNLDMAIPCGLIINEIISNSLKYAFKGRKKGTIETVLEKKNNEIILMISDNGVGMPAEIDYKNTESLGLQLVITLVDQLGGKIQMQNKGGTKYIINFSENQSKH